MSPTSLQYLHVWQEASEVMARANGEGHAAPSPIMSAQAQGLSACLEILATAYRLHQRVTRAEYPGLNSAAPDWRWPKSHASLILAAAVRCIVHKLAQTCRLCDPLGAGQNLAYIHLMICLVPSRIPPNL
jgi:hypothetical protein